MLKRRFCLIVLQRRIRKYSVFMVLEQEFQNIRFNFFLFLKIAIFYVSDSGTMVGVFEEMKPKINSGGNSLGIEKAL